MLCQIVQPNDAAVLTNVYAFINGKLPLNQLLDECVTIELAYLLAIISHTTQSLNRVMPNCVCLVKNMRALTE